MRRHAWFLNVPFHMQIRPLLSRLLQNEKPTVAEVATLERQLSDCKMNERLRRMMSLSMRRLMNIGDQVAFSTCVEILAGMDYAQRDSGVGTLRHLKQYASKHVAGFLRKECDRLIQMRAWRHRDAWFMLRVACMDAYALARVLTGTNPAVYYAGSAHTSRLLAFLRDDMNATRAETMPASFQTIAHDAATHGVRHVECVNVEGRLLLMLGENHLATDLQFADRMLAFLRDACNTRDVDVFIEKHLSNAKDPLQCDLMCNQPHVAIHRIRCDDITTSTCANLAVVPVDNRHADLGFLRTEILDMWACDDDFKRAAIKFQKTAIKDMHALCDTLA